MTVKIPAGFIKRLVSLKVFYLEARRPTQDNANTRVHIIIVTIAAFVILWSIL